MSDRDWEKELAKIDKQLASVSDEELAKPKTALPAAAPTGMPRGAAATAARATAAPAPSAAGNGRAKFWALVKLSIAVGAAVGLTLWPWSARCGIALAGFVGACGGAFLLGTWSAFGTWRSRLGLAHVASLLVIVWVGVLGAREVLPRVGYAIPTFERPDRWECQVAPPGANDPAGEPGTDAPTTPTPGAPELPGAEVPAVAPGARRTL